MRILYADIEVSPAVLYSYDLWNPQNKAAVTRYPSIISIAYKWSGDKKPKVLVVDEMYKDHDILKAFAEIYAQADATVMYNGDSFDTKYINTRMLMNGLDPLPPIKQIDPYKLVKKHFKFLSNSLEYVAKSLGIEEKGKIPWSTWQACIEGDKKALKAVVEYNKQDVVVLEQLYEKVKPYCHGLIIHPKVKDAVFCRACDSPNLERRGYLLTAAGLKRQRYHCKDCHSWSTGK